jgi:hypothetical protein
MYIVQNAHIVHNIFIKAEEPNSRTYNFVDVSRHYIESFQTRGFRLYVLHYKSVSNHLCPGGGGGGVKRFLVDFWVMDFVKVLWGF